MSDNPMFAGTVMSPELKQGWYWFVIAGVIMFIGGLLAMFRPFAASITVEMIVGWTFIFSGITNIIQSFRNRANTSGGGFLLSMALGILSILLGISLLKNPLAGLMSLTLVVAILILLAGVAKVVYGLRMRPYDGWLYLTLSGIISVILAILISTHFFGAALVTLGIMLAIELISSGILLTMIGFKLKKL